MGTVNQAAVDRVRAYAESNMDALVTILRGGPGLRRQGGGLVMAISAFGVEDNRISKVNRGRQRDKVLTPVKYGGATSAGAAAGALAGAAVGAHPRFSGITHAELDERLAARKAARAEHRAAPSANKLAAARRAAPIPRSVRFGARAGLVGGAAAGAGAVYAARRHNRDR